MKLSRTTLSALALAMAAASAPALAGNYAEGDPRPTAFTSQLSRADVARQTSQWVATAPSPGLAEGDARARENVGQRSRLQVQAEARAWVGSGLAQLSQGEANLDTRSPAYVQAARAYEQLTGQASARGAGTQLQ